MTEFSFRGRTRGFGRQTRRAIRMSRLAIAAERLARAFWPVVTILCFVAAAALFGLFLGLEPRWHRAVLVAAGLALAGATAVGLFRWQVPGLDDATRRLDGGDPGRPLATLTDHIAVGRDEKRSETIWHAHVARAEKAAAGLRARAPDLNLAPFDHWALRLFAVVLLAGSLIAAGPDWAERLRSIGEPGRTPGAVAATPRADPAAEAWATPPAYTGLDTIYLTDVGADGPAPSVPQGSELIVRVTDFDGLPVIEGDTLSGFESFTSFGGGLAEARAIIDRSGSLSVLADGDELARWELTVTPDEAPVIETAGEPTRAVSGALEVAFRTTDDYGVISAWAEIVVPGGIEPGRGMIEEPIVFALPLPISGRATNVEDSAIRDLTAHPWAGAEVEMVLIAEDGSEQRGRSEPLRFRLPERRFLDPLARALVEQRRDLALDYTDAERVLDVLQAVTRRPEQIFEDNRGAYMGVRTAIRRLAAGVFDDAVPAVAPEVVELLWLAALAIEDGDLSDALERLRTAEQRLREALENGSEQDIAQALDELRQAMNQYLEQLTQQAMQNPQQQQGQQGQQQNQSLSQQDLQEMLDQIQRNAEGGLRDQARDMLSELSRMLENLQAGNPQMQQGGPGQQALQELQELIQRQRDLADQTFDEMREQRRNPGRSNDGGTQGETRGQQGQEGQQGEGQMGQGQQGGQGEPGGDPLGKRQPGQPGGQGQPMPGENGQPGGSLAEQQRQLREALEELARQLPGGEGNEAGEALGEAGDAMGDAADDLDRDANADAVQDQMEALDRLNESATQLAEQIQNGQGEQGAEGRQRGNQGPSQDALETDPFDRPSGAYGAVDGRDTNVPDRSALDRARELLEELRRRSGEPDRRQLELEYYDRLIDRF